MLAEYVEERKEVDREETAKLQLKLQRAERHVERLKLMRQQDAEHGAAGDAEPEADE